MRLYKVIVNPLPFRYFCTTASNVVTLSIVIDLEAKAWHLNFLERNGITIIGKEEGQADAPKAHCLFSVKHIDAVLVVWY